MRFLASDAASFITATDLAADGAGRATEGSEGARSATRPAGRCGSESASSGSTTR